MDFKDTIDKISETLTSASKDIAKKAKDLVDVNTVKSSIHDQKRIIRKAYEKIGEQYYNDHVDAGDYAYEQEFEVIGEANATLKELYNQLHTLKNIGVCPECGAIHDADAVFCSKCGIKLNKMETYQTKDESYEDESFVDAEEDEVEIKDAEFTEPVKDDAQCSAEDSKENE